MVSRPYRDWNDFEEMQRLVGEVRPNISNSHCLHRGDLAWQLFHMLNNYDPSELVQLWEEDGKLLGFALIYLPFAFFDIQIRINQRIEFEEVLSWAEERFQRSNIPPKNELKLFTLVNENDIPRIRLLEKHGFERGGVWHYLERSLDVPIPEPRVPDGFLIRTIRDLSEAGTRANLLASVFEGIPDVEKYRRFMQSRVYNEALDLVVAASDGTLAAFAMGWIDPISKHGQFEPVGTAPVFRRLRLGQALLLEGLRRMQTQNMERAFVIVEGADRPALQLYSSVGLVPRWNLYMYNN